MLSLFNPQVLLAICFALATAFGFGRHYEHLEQQAEIARLNKVMAEQAHDSQLKFNKQELDAQNKINRLRADVNSGTLRLSIPVSSSCSSTSGSTEARAELDTTTANDLISITEDGDKAIRELNYCIDRYNQVKDTK